MLYSCYVQVENFMVKTFGRVAAVVAVEFGRPKIRWCPRSALCSWRCMLPRREQNDYLVSR